jgi:hypothetical protein
MSYDEMIEKRRLDAIDAREAADKQAEHDVSCMFYDEPEALIAMFHEGATKEDLGAMDDVLIKYLKSVGEHEESPLYDAVVRIFKELN